MKAQAIPFDSHAQERTILLWLMGQAFFSVAALMLVYVASNAIFLSTFGAGRIPYVYIATGVVVSALSYGIVRLQQRWSLATIAIGTTAVVTLTYLAAWFALGRPDSEWVSFVLMVMFPLHGALLVGIAIGGQAGRLFDVRQMKRLWPTVFAATVAGAILGSLLSPWLPGGARMLLLWAVVAMGLGQMLLWLTVQRFAGELNQAPTQQGSGGAAKSFGQLLRQPYTLNLLGYQMLSAIGTQLVVYIFFALAETQFGNDTNGLAGFLGNFVGARNIFTIVVQLGVAGYVMNRFGLRFGMAANPLLVLVLVVITAVYATFINPAGTLLFWIAIVAYALDNALSDAITNTSIKTAYQAVPATNRGVVETTVEGIGVPVAFGLTGLLLLLFNAIPSLSLIHIIWFTVLVCILWTAAAFRAYGNYTGALLRGLNRRALGEAELSLDDGASLAAVEKLVQSDKLREVRLALDMLTEAEHGSLNGRLLDLLNHPNSDIKAESLQRIETRQVGEALPKVEAMLRDERDVVARGTAVRAFCALAEDDLVEAVQPYLDDGLSETSIGAIVGLLRYGGISGVLAAGAQLTKWQASDDCDERYVAARAIGEVGVPNFYRPLIPLLQDQDARVRREALVASSRVHHPRLLPYVIDNLANPLTRSAAMSALVATGERLLPTVAAALAGESGYDEEDVIRMVRVCGQLKGAAVIETLKPHIDHPDNDVQLAVLQALQQADFQAAAAADVAEVNCTMLGEVAHGLRVLLAKQDLTYEPPFVQLQRALDHEYEEARQRTFLLLSFIYDARAILQAEKQLVHGNRASQALALETLDVTLTSEQKRLVFPLVDAKLTPKEQIGQLQTLFDLDHLSLLERLTEIIRDPEGEWTNGWTRACGLHVVGELAQVELTAVVEEALAIDEHPVHETAVWALYRLDPSRLSSHVEALIASCPNGNQAGDCRSLMLTTSIRNKNHVTNH
ncbi:MAG: HEAT repeat domain-containing protein [Chloroflexota bacterium]